MLIVPTTFKSVSIPSFMKIYRACFKKNLMTFFLVVTPFLGPFSTLPFFTHGDSYFLSLYTHTHTVFHVSTPCFCSRNNKYCKRHLFILIRFDFCFCHPH